MPLTICWHCDRPLDAATALEDGNHVAAGAVSLCMYCAAVGIFTTDLALRPPTTDELDDLGDDSEFRVQYARFTWARQYVILQSNLLRDREDPDR